MAAEKKKDLEDLYKDFFPDKGEGAPFLGIKEARAEFSKFSRLLILTALILKENADKHSLSFKGISLSGDLLVSSLIETEETVFPLKGVYGKIFENLMSREREGFLKGALLPLAGLFFNEIISAQEFFSVELSFEASLDINIKNSLKALTGEHDGLPTEALIYDIGKFFLSDEENEKSGLSDPMSFSNLYLFDYPLLRLSSAAKDFLFLEKRFPLVSMQCACLLEKEALDEKLIGHEMEKEELVRSLKKLSSLDGTGHVIEITGEKGTGRTYLSRYAAKELFADIISFSVSQFSALPAEQKEKALSGTITYAVLNNALLLLTDLPEGDDLLEGENKKEVLLLFGYLKDRLPVILVKSKRPLHEALYSTLPSVNISVSEPDTSLQVEFWDYFFNKIKKKISKGLSPKSLASLYFMTPGRICDVIRSAEALCAEDQKIDMALLSECIRRCSAVDFGRNASRLESRFTWEDLKLPETSIELLKEACGRIKNRYAVMNAFGFEKKLPYGKGTSVCFYGPPGTGKTMAAEVIANDLGLDLYRIDLSQIESKYIGETQKNLSSIFDAARNSNAILFFDEADVLFGKRTEAKDSNDRHANSETAYLLQKIEEYRGVSILATNIAQNFDNAFKRRITYMIPIEMPDENTRLLLWKSVFPKDAPLDKKIDLEKLARKAELTGAQIKSAALRAAYLAAGRGEKEKITADDIAKGVELEYQKSGHITGKLIL